MEKWRQTYFFPIELNLFVLFVSIAWLLSVWQIGIPYVEYAERNPWPFVSSATSSTITAYGFALISFLAIAGGIGVVWWKLTLKAHCLRMLAGIERVFNHIFRNCVPPWLGLFGNN